MASLNVDPSKVPDPPPPVDKFHRPIELTPAELPAPAVPTYKPPAENLDLPEALVVQPPEPEPPDLTAWRADQIKRYISEIAKRKVEALRLYEPLPSQHRFHVSKAEQRILRGSNRSGKTLGAAVEFARAVTGQDPHGKYPAKNGRAYIVGKDGKEVSGVMWRKLYRAEGFKMIRDETTGIWRAFRPLSLADQARKAEAKWAPPLIPRRFIRTIAWENKKEGLPSLIQLQNGWEINCFSSLGKPPTGSDVDLVWFDEEIVDPEWYPEVIARLLDRCGHFIWSATPQAGTEQLYALHERAEAQFGNADPQVEEFVVLLADNPHVPQEQKDKFAASLSERDAEVRIGGEFALVSFKVFPEYDSHLHTIPWFEIPPTWTRYAVVDPGRQVCAVLFAAVPDPVLPQHAGHIYLYDEIYIRNANAAMFGREMSNKCRGQNFHTFLIDHHGSRMHDQGGGLTIELQYAAALKEHNVKSLATGFNFVWGNDDKRAGIEAVRTLLTKHVGDKPKLLLLADKLPNCDWEFRHFRFKRIKDQILDDAMDRGRVHLMACLRYLALHGPKYYKPPVGKQHGSGALGAFKAKQKKKRERDGGGTISLGRGPRRD
jgi:hypothetical protein